MVVWRWRMNGVRSILQYWSRDRLHSVKEKESMGYAIFIVQPMVLAALIWGAIASVTNLRKKMRYEHVTTVRRRGRTEDT